MSTSAVVVLVSLVAFVAGLLSLTRPRRRNTPLSRSSSDPDETPVEPAWQHFDFTVQHPGAMPSTVKPDEPES